MHNFSYINWRLSLLLGLLILAMCPSFVSAQRTDVTGLIYYVIENRDRGQVEQRGTAGRTGVAFDRLILAPETRYRIWLLQAETLRVAEANFRTPRSGQSFQVPDFDFHQASSHDTDNDGLSDLGEFIMGTDGRNPDSDGDGISDSSEIIQGLDPLSGLAVRTGIIGNIDTRGSAIDICAFDDIAIVADSNGGISVFNIFNAMNPILIAQVDTDGSSIAIDCSGDLIGVANGPAGINVIDISDPPNAINLHRIGFNGAANSIVTTGDIAYVGLSTGRIITIDMRSGAEIDQIVTGSPVHDLGVSGDALHVLTARGILIYDLLTDGLVQIGQVNVSGNTSPLETGRKLFVGSGLAYVGHFTGYSVVDISDPTTPVVVGTPPQTQAAIHDLASNGSGLLVSTTSFGGVGTLEVSLYDDSEPTDVTRLLTSFDTPGDARGLTLYNGIAYIADSQAGIQVVNYQAFDALGIPPTVQLQTPFADGFAEEGKLMRVTALAEDDVQVRNVEFYVDGVEVGTDGNYPFEIRFTTPLLVDGKTQFTIRARVSDTGGNATWSEELVLELVPDATPPRIVDTLPEPNSIQGALNSVAVTFSEPIIDSELSNQTIRIIGAGSDEIFFTADDQQLAGTLSYRSNINTAVISYDSNLEPGSYRGTVSSEISDLAGNPLASDFSWTFRIFSLQDLDRDGVPDELEEALGLNPLDRDSDGDGIIDGLEDFDRDGLVNSGEILLGLDPNNADSDSNGIKDGDEDLDADFLTNKQEIELGTNPLLADSDADGWNDEAEISGLSDPNDSNDTPKLFVVGYPKLNMGVSGFDDTNSIPFGSYVAKPSVKIGIVSFEGSDLSAIGNILAKPPVSISTIGFYNDPAFSEGTTVARPPVRIETTQ